MLSDKLKLWIAQSESWQTFIDFNLSQETMVNYEFLPRNDDFYISLFGSLIDLLNEDEFLVDKWISIAKWLEIYSIQNKSDKFQWIDKANNMLFASWLYYLSNYSSSASLLVKRFTVNDFFSDIDKFIWSFLWRRNLEVTHYGTLLKQFLDTWDTGIYDSLLEIIEVNKIKYLEYDPNLYCSYLLANKILSKFKESNIWNDLLQYNSKDYWNDFIKQSLIKKTPVWDFFPSQRIALEAWILWLDYKAISIQTPTSSWKTAICELLIFNYLKQFPNNKILYLAPFRSLASELKKSFSKNLKSLGVEVKAIYGWDIPTLEERNSIENINILISTPEKFLALENMDSAISSQFNLIICDEWHLLDASGQRWLSFELLLSRIKKDENKRFIFISAIVPNIEEINNWLWGDTVIRSNYRATEIELAFLKKSTWLNKFELEVNPTFSLPKKYILYNFLTELDLKYKKQWKTRLLNKTDTTNKAYSAIIALKALNAWSVALFAPTKWSHWIQWLVEELIEQIHIKKPNLYSHLTTSNTNKDILTEYFSLVFWSDYMLTRAVNSWILYHHGDLPQYVRELIESNIREEKIRLVVCTTTLGEWVNLPIKTIVIHTTRRGQGSFINLRDLKNLFGRAWRAGQEMKWMIIVANKNDFDMAKHVILEEEIEEVKWFLYRIISSLTTHNVEIDENFINNLNEESLKSIDAIDSAIIDLLEETIDVANFEQNIESLTSQTFAFYQSSDEEKVILRKFINLRWRKIKTLIESWEFNLVKTSNFSMRTYETIKDSLDLDNSIWIDLENPIDDNWLDFILGIILQDNTIIECLLEFNQNKDSLKIIIKAWLSWNWFKNIALLIYTDADVDSTLKIINQLIGYHIQSKLGSIIHFAEKKLAEEGKAMSEVILNFPQYLIYWIQSKIELDLIELWFTEREWILKLSKELIRLEIHYNWLLELKANLIFNKEGLIESLRSEIPIVSLNEIEKSFSYLSDTDN
jgi:helicase